MESGRVVLAFISMFVPLLGAGYVVGLSDRDSKALADIYRDIESLPNGAGVTFRYRCDFPTEGRIAVREVTYDPSKAADAASGEPTVTIGMQRYLLGLPQQMRLRVSKEAISALIGGASGGLTLASIGKVAKELNATSTLSMSRFQWRRLPLRAKATQLARKTGRAGMMVIGILSGYSAGYALATRQPGCESADALAKIATKEFWRNYSKHHAVLALASVLEETQRCSNTRFEELIVRAQASSFQPTPADLAYLDALAAEVECATRPGRWHVPKGICAGSIIDIGSEEPRTLIDACSALSDSMPPDIAAWHAISKDCWEYSTKVGAQPCDASMQICGKDNPRYRHLTKRYAQAPAALAQISAGRYDVLHCPASPTEPRE